MSLSQNLTSPWSFFLAAKRMLRHLAVVAAVVIGVAQSAHAATVTELFAKRTEGSKLTIDHSAWDMMLKSYVVPSPDGINRVDYAQWKAQKHAPLKAYIASLESVDVAKLGRNEQFAFWANLYNAKTIDVVLDNYPVKSIREISIDEGLFGFLKSSTGYGGPWKAKLLTVKGHKLSLDDIEHSILRPIFKDPRVHYAVNCASLGCPNLMQQAFTGAALDAQLDAGARAFINRKGALQVVGGKVSTSSIYDWFQKDFGSNMQAVIEHVRKYANDDLRQKLASAQGIADYGYDWSLNDVKRN